MAQPLNKQFPQNLVFAGPWAVHDPAGAPACETRHAEGFREFSLPTGLCMATVGLYLVFIGTMAVLFLNLKLALPLVFFAGLVVFAFGLAGQWTMESARNSADPFSWAQLSARSIEL